MCNFKILKIKNNIRLFIITRVIYRCNLYVQLVLCIYESIQVYNVKNTEKRITKSHFV